MSNLFWLTDEQMARLQPYFPKSHGRQRVDDRRVLSGIIFVNRNGLRWCDAPKEYGPSKTLYNRWKRWGDKGIFLQMMEGLAVPEAAERKTIMIDATLSQGPPHGFQPAGKKGGSGPPVWAHERRHKHQASCRNGCEWSPDQFLHNGRSGQRIHRCCRLA